MQFSRKKLPKEALASLRRVEVATCEPYGILLTPVYVYLPKNQKFVAIKAPLQFFSPTDLEKNRPLENFYLPEFVKQIIPFQNAGAKVRNLLTTRQKYGVKTNSGDLEVVLPVPQYQLDDAVLQVTGPLWSKGVQIEPFFLCFFAEEVCDPLPPEKLVRSAEENIELFELALLRASTAVFFALHLGYCDLTALKNIREQVFDNTVFGTARFSNQGETAELVRLIRAAIPSAETRSLSLQRIMELLHEPGNGGKSTRKLISRLSRVNAELIKMDAPAPSIYGEQGFIDE
ncbi:MAG: hypothetical protein P4M08_10485 [Oligoflexia bacterium]|nr:hypothetical protein [Oligoflexia bacterium]